MFEHEQETVREERARESTGPEPVVEALFPDSFRGGNGTQVGSGPRPQFFFSACAVAGGYPVQWWTRSPTVKRAR